MSADDADDMPGPEMQFLKRLHDLGVPLWTGGEGFNSECSRPLGWQNLTCEENLARLARFRWDFQPFIGANTGIPVTVVDVDPRNGGDIDKVRALLASLKVRIFAEITTPSGGVHLHIKGHPDLPSVHSTEDNQRLPGYPGVDLQSHGCNVFLPATMRTKYGWTPYIIVFDELDQLAILDEDDDGGAGALVDWVAEQLAIGVKSKARKTSGGAKEWAWDPREPWDGTPPDRRQKAYLHSALAREADKVARTAKGGRNDALFVAALKLGSYVAGAGLHEPVVIAALEAAAETNGYTAEDGLRATSASIRSGLRAGKKNPRAVPEPKEHREETSVDTDGQAAQEQDTPGGITPSWGRIDLSGVLSGDRKTVVATLLERTDGVALMYPGLVHDFHGESDTGKSFVVQAECVLAINRGEDVLYIDHESDATSVTDRLITLGADPLTIAKHFDYRQPDAKPTTAAEVVAWTEMLSHRYTLAVIDGVTDALGIWGYSIKDNDDLAAWSRQVARRIATATGAAVGLIDHVTKDPNSRGRWAIGGQAKMAGLTGASYVVEVSKIFGLGLCGEVVLRLGKDRPGTLKRHCGPLRKSDRTQEAARIVIDSTGDKTAVTVNPWKGSSADGEPQDREPFRPTFLMVKASRTIEADPGKYTKTGAAVATYGNKDFKLLAVDLLREEGYVTREKVGRDWRYTSAKPYREANDPRSDKHSNLGDRLRDAHESKGGDDDDSDTP